jgi:hypothetical protein
VVGMGIMVAFRAMNARVAGKIEGANRGTRKGALICDGKEGWTVVFGGVNVIWIKPLRKLVKNSGILGGNRGFGNGFYKLFVEN